MEIAPSPGMRIATSRPCASPEELEKYRLSLQFSSMTLAIGGPELSLWLVDLLFSKHYTNISKNSRSSVGAAEAQPTKPPFPSHGPTHNCPAYHITIIRLILIDIKTPKQRSVLPTSWCKIPKFLFGIFPLIS